MITIVSNWIAQIGSFLANLILTIFNFIISLFMI